MKTSILTLLLPAMFFALTAASPAPVGIPRLGNDIVPIAYDLSFVPDLGTKRTTGDETIRLEVARQTATIILNWAGISISDVTLDGQSVTAQVQTKLEQLWIRPAVPVMPGAHVLRLRFVSPIVEFDQKGFFNDGFRSGRPFLVTMFEPSTARLMFPSFDEPGFRSSFTIHVTVPSPWTVVSNMPVALETPVSAAQKRVDFQPTPPMPTYLLTVDAGVMKALTGSSDGVPIRVFSDPTMSDTELILPRAERVLHYYDTYLGIPYALPKLDVVAAPGMLKTALEQWGAMTFYDGTDITTGNVSDPDTARRRAFDELAHEMGHQWFGDLVGMQWWRDTFVAEGLTEWLATKADASLEPTWAWYRDTDSTVDYVMQTPISAKTRPVISSVTTDYERDDWAPFSLATYDKSAALLNMWEAYIGEQRFREALQRYLRRYSGSAVTFEDFWNSFNDPMARRYGDAWLKRPGFPALQVTTSCKATRQFLTLTQMAFVDAPTTPRGYKDQIWPVPIVLNIGQSPANVLLLERKRQVIAAGTCGQNVAIDRDLRPYYRLWYAQPDATVSRLSEAGERDRNNAVRDAVALNDAGYAPADYFLRFVGLVRPSDPPDLLQKIAARYAALLLSLAPGIERDAVAASARAIFGPIVQKVPASTGGGEPQPYTWAIYTLALARYPEFAPRAQQQIDALVQAKRPAAWALTPPLAAIAASAPDRKYLDSMEAVVDKAVQKSRAPLQFETNSAEWYVANVGTQQFAEEVLHRYASQPAIVFQLAQRQPAVVWKFLKSHTREVLSRIAPSQQAGILAQKVGDAFWYLPPAELRSYLESKFGPYNRALTNMTLQKVAKKRAAASKAAAEVRRWMRP